MDTSLLSKATLPTKAKPLPELMSLPDGSKMISTRRFVPDLMLIELTERFALNSREWMQVNKGASICYGSGRSIQEKRRFRKDFYKLKRLAAERGTPIVAVYSGGRLERFKIADLASEFDRQILQSELSNAARRAELGQQTVEAIQHLLNFDKAA